MLTNAIVNQPRLPFDWTQMNVLSMKKVVELDHSEIADFWNFYFSCIDESNYNDSTGSWFPHDTFQAEEKTKTIEKYIRRTERFLEILDMEIPKVFVILFGFPDEFNMVKTSLLIATLKHRSKGQNVFLVCNAKEEETIDNDTFYMYETLDCLPHEKDENESWERLTHVLTERVKRLLHSLKLEAIAIPSSIRIGSIQF